MATGRDGVDAWTPGSIASGRVLNEQQEAFLVLQLEHLI